MEAKEVYDWLEKIRALVHAAELPDGTLDADSIKIEIALEFCETQIRQAIAAGPIDTGSLD